MHFNKSDEKFDQLASLKDEIWTSNNLNSTQILKSKYLCKKIKNNNNNKKKS
jgi:hypothetical protein